MKKYLQLIIVLVLLFSTRSQAQFTNEILNTDFSNLPTVSSSVSSVTTGTGAATGYSWIRTTINNTTTTWPYFGSVTANNITTVVIGTSTSTSYIDFPAVDFVNGGTVYVEYGSGSNREYDLQDVTTGSAVTTGISGGNGTVANKFQVDNTSAKPRNTILNCTFTLTAANFNGTKKLRIAFVGGSDSRIFKVIFKTSNAGTPPTVNTTSASAITTVAASAGGNVTAEGTAPVTAKGMVWSTTYPPTIASPTFTNDGTGLGVFTSAITGLTANTKYFDVAYATSTVGTAYGAQDSFVTYSLAPLIAAASNISLTGFNANWTAPVQGSAAFTYSLEYGTDNTFTTGVTTVSSIPSGTTSQTLSGLSSGATYYYRVRISNAAGFSAYSAVQSVILIDGTLATDYFRSAASGNWNAAASWESSHNNSTWTAATSGPDNNASAIQIKTGHTLTVTATATANNVTIDAGGQLVVNSGNTFTVANGTGTDITVNGTVKNIGTFTLATSATMNVGATGVYEDAQAATTATITLPTATWSAGSTCKLTGLIGTAGTNPTDYNSLQGVNQTFSNFIIDVPNLIGKLVVTKNAAALFAVTGTLTVNSTGTSSYGVQLTSSGAQESITVGNYVQNAGLVSILHNSSNTTAKTLTVTGAFTLNGTSAFNISAYTTGTGSSTLNVGGNLTIAPGAILQRNTSLGFGGTSKLVFNGTAAQTATFNALAIDTIQYTINNTAGLILGSDLNVRGSFTFTAGNLTTNAFKLFVDSSGSVVGGGTGWVVGNLQKRIATGATTKTFEIGGNTNYRPVTVSFGNVTTAGNILATVSQSAGDHPQIATSGINAAKSVNRYWTLTNSGIVFDNYSAAFTFVAGDIDAGANTANFVVRKYNGTSWSNTTTGTQTATSTQATGLTSFSDFAIGEVTPFSVTLTNFRGEQAGSVNKLSWNTATENNNKGFELERSADGIHFNAITFIATKAGNGNSTTAIAYSYDDVKASAGNSYYRLKQIDNDGKYSYSNVVLLSRKVTEITLASVYPNPTKAELNIKIISPRAEKLTVVVTDLTGKVIMQITTDVLAGDNVKQVNVASLTTGSYLVKAFCANGCETTTQRFLKQ